MKKVLFWSVFSALLIMAFTAVISCSSPVSSGNPSTPVWQQVGSAGFSAGTATYTSLALNSGGTPYIAYEDYGNNQKASVMKFNGTSWVQVGTAGFSAGAVAYTSLAVDSNGTPYVAYDDYGNSYKVSVMEFK